MNAVSVKERLKNLRKSSGKTFDDGISDRDCHC